VSARLPRSRSSTAVVEVLAAFCLQRDSADDHKLDLMVGQQGDQLVEF
jgi:hypothetical protein